MNGLLSTGKEVLRLFAAEKQGAAHLSCRARSFKNIPDCCWQRSPAIKKLAQQEGTIQPIYLNVDNHLIHRLKMMREFVESTDGMLRLFHLPPYLPGLDPDEQVWNYVNNHNISRQSAKNKKDFMKRVMRVMHSLQKLPNKRFT